MFLNRPFMVLSFFSFFFLQKALFLISFYNVEYSSRIAYVVNNLNVIRDTIFEWKNTHKTFIVVLQLFSARNHQYALRQCTLNV